MSIADAGISRDASDLERLGSWRPYWLPPGGFGNGLSASFWAQVAEIPRHSVLGLLNALREQAIPGWAAPMTRTGHHADLEPDDAPYRLWVATGGLNQAEEQLMRVLNDAAAHSALSDTSSRAPAVAARKRHRGPGR